MSFRATIDLSKLFDDPHIRWEHIAPLMVLGWILITMAIQNEQGGYVNMSVSSIQKAHSAMLGHALRGQSRSKNIFLQSIFFFLVNIIIRF